DPLPRVPERPVRFSFKTRLRFPVSGSSIDRFVRVRASPAPQTDDNDSDNDPTDYDLSPTRRPCLVLQRRLTVLRLLAPHERSADVRRGPTVPCGASNRNRQTRRCNTRPAVPTEVAPAPPQAQGASSVQERSISALRWDRPTSTV